MKVLYDTQIFSMQRYGGISRYFIELMNCFRAEGGVEAHCVAGAHCNAYLRELPTSEVTGFYVPLVRKTYRVRQLFNRTCQTAVEQLGRWDVIHDTYYGYAPRWRNATAARVTTVHDMIHEQYPELFPADAPEPAAKRASVEAAASVVCVSQATLRHLQTCFSRPLNAVVIPHGYTPMQSSPTTGLQVKEITGGRPYWLFVGKRDLYKNFQALAEAYVRSRARRDSILLLFGGGKPTDDEWSTWTALGISRSQLLYVEGDDTLLAACYESALAMIYPSLYEGFGIPILEAFSVDCPVICSDIDVFREVAGTAATFSQPTADALATALDEAIEAPRDTLAQARAACLSQYSWSRSARMHAALYESVCP